MVHVTLMSAGFKFGHPPASHIFDVTSCPNPRRDVALLRDDYPAWMHHSPVIQHRIEAIAWYVEQVAPVESGIFAICCTGGQDRSPFITEQVAARVRQQHLEWDVRVIHREASEGVHLASVPPPGASSGPDSDNAS